MKKIEAIYSNNGKKTKVVIDIDSTLTAMTFVSDSHKVINSKPSEAFVGELKGLDLNENEIDKFTPIARVSSITVPYKLDLIYDKKDKELYLLPALDGIEYSKEIMIKGSSIANIYSGTKEYMVGYTGDKFNIVDKTYNCNTALVDIPNLKRGYPINTGEMLTDNSYFEVMTDTKMQCIVLGSYKNITGDPFSAEFNPIAPIQTGISDFNFTKLKKDTYNLLVIPIP